MKKTVKGLLVSTALLGLVGGATISPLSNSILGIQEVQAANAEKGRVTINISTADRTTNTSRETAKVSKTSDGSGTMYTYFADDTTVMVETDNLDPDGLELSTAYTEFTTSGTKRVNDIDLEGNYYTINLNLTTVAEEVPVDEEPFVDEPIVEVPVEEVPVVEVPVEEEPEWVEVIPGETPVVEEEAPVVEEVPVEEETPVVEEEAPVEEDNSQTPVVDDPEWVEETPVVEEEAPVVEEEAPVVEEETPVVEEETPVVEEETPVVEEETPVVEEVPVVTPETLTEDGNDTIIVTPRKSVAVNGIYTVAAGDTLLAIAEDFGISTANLALWNNLDSDLVFVNDKLFIVAQALVQTPETSVEEVSSENKTNEVTATDKKESEKVIATVEKDNKPTKLLQTDVSTLSTLGTAGVGVSTIIAGVYSMFSRKKKK